MLLHQCAVYKCNASKRLAPHLHEPEAAYNERFVIGVCCYTAERAEKKSRNSPTSFAWVLLSLRANNSNIQHLVRTALWAASKASRNFYG